MSDPNVTTTEVLSVTESADNAGTNSQTTNASPTNPAAPTDAGAELTE